MARCHSEPSGRASASCTDTGSGSRKFGCTAADVAAEQHISSRCKWCHEAPVPVTAESDLALHTDKEACRLAEDSELSLHVAGEPHGARKVAMPNRPSGLWIRASTPRTVPPVLCLCIGIDMMGMSAGGGLRRAALRQRRRRVRLLGGGFDVEWSGCSSDRDCGASDCFIHDDMGVCTHHCDWRLPSNCPRHCRSSVCLSTRKVGIRRCLIASGAFWPARDSCMRHNGWSDIRSNRWSGSSGITLGAPQYLAKPV